MFCGTWMEMKRIRRTGNRLEGNDKFDIHEEKGVRELNFLALVIMA